MLEEMGFAEIPGVLAAGQCGDAAEAIDATDGGRAGSRNLLDLPSCRDLVAMLKAHAEIGPLLPPQAVAVQCTLFDKSADKNWLVALHQDLSIPVHQRILHPECSGWSEKEGGPTDAASPPSCIVQGASCGTPSRAPLSVRSTGAAVRVEVALCR
ncbi:MAG TPA: hypothetical protein VNF52_09340, partial [Candidatus Dormibacteraeota bacterium]|nr:hypothetical protein [Candidatus Dormibacteraeota bacterium]